MKKSLLKSTLFLLIILFIISIIFITRPLITQDTKAFTQAICNEDNYCKDYKITCENKQIKSVFPTGFAIQNSDNWNDPRAPEELEKVCD